jgi:hypothetical protein
MSDTNKREAQEVTHKEAAVEVQGAPVLETRNQPADAGTPEGMVRVDGKLFPRWRVGFGLVQSKDFPEFLMDANGRIYERLRNGQLVRRTYKKNERRTK